MQGDLNCNNNHKGEFKIKETSTYKKILFTNG